MTIIKSQYFDAEGQDTVLYLDLDAIAAVTVVYQGTTIMKSVITLKSGKEISVISYEFHKLVIAALEGLVRR